jgi:hypothetical protein
VESLNPEGLSSDFAETHELLDQENIIPKGMKEVNNICRSVLKQSPKVIPAQLGCNVNGVKRVKGVTSVKGGLGFRGVKGKRVNRGNELKGIKGGKSGKAVQVQVKGFVHLIPKQGSILRFRFKTSFEILCIP